MLLHQIILTNLHLTAALDQLRFTLRQQLRALIQLLPLPSHDLLCPRRPIRYRRQHPPLLSRQLPGQVKPLGVV